jgi:hypothetical protein
MTVMVNILRTAAAVALGISAASGADVSGKWNVSAVGPGGRESKLELVLKKDGDKVTGAIGNDRGAVDISEAKLDGNELSFKIVVEATYSVKLTLSAESMKGTSTGSDGSTWQVSAVRAPASVSAAGKWNMLAKSQGGREYNIELDLKEDAGKLGGTFTAEGMTLAVEDAKLEGSQLSFKIQTDRGPYTLKLAVEGNSMNGSYAGPEGQSGSLTAKRGQ